MEILDYKNRLRSWDEFAKFGDLDNLCLVLSFDWDFINIQKIKLDHCTDFKNSYEPGFCAHCSNQATHCLFRGIMDGIGLTLRESRICSVCAQKWSKLISCNP